MPFFLWRRFFSRTPFLPLSYIFSHFYHAIAPFLLPLYFVRLKDRLNRVWQPSTVYFFFYVFCIFFFCFTFAHTDYFLHFSETRAGNYAYCCYLKFQTVFKPFALNRNGTKRRYYRDISINLPFMYMRYT